MNVISLRNSFLIYILPNFLANLKGVHFSVVSSPSCFFLFFFCKNSFGKVVLSFQKDFVMNTITKSIFYNRNFK